MDEETQYTNGYYADFNQNPFYNYTWKLSAAVTQLGQL